METKPLRALMPESAAIVDAFRSAGLTDNAAIKAGMQYGGFYVVEAGHEVGTRSTDGQGVTPVLSYAAEKRLADLWWEREQARARS